MKIIRSSKCSIKFATNKKKQELQTILKEYGKVVNVFIDHFWTNSDINKTKLLKPVVDLPQTWLSARLRKVAAREALDMISSVKEVLDWNKEQLQNAIDALEKKIAKTNTLTKENRRKINNWHKKLKSNKSKLLMTTPHKPIHKGERMCVSCTIGELQTVKKADNFDSWLHLASIGNKITLDIPIKFHKQFNNLNKVGKRLNSYIITKDCVQFSFEIETGIKKEVHTIIGLDTGINALASLSTGKQLRIDIKDHIARAKRCKYGSNGHKRASRALRQKIDEVAKQVVRNTDLVVVENLTGISNNSKLKGRLSKNIRSSIGKWNQGYWMGRLEQNCESNRVSFRSVSPYNTSITCSICGNVDRANRLGEVFVCSVCAHTENADINAAKNILNRFVTGKYGSCYRPKNQAVLACPELSSL